MKDIEDRLRQLQPPGPPAELRGRVVGAVRSGSRTSRGRLLEWVPAAIAAGVAVGFYLAGAGVRARTDGQIAGAARERESAIEQLSDSMGGDLIARQAAEAAIGWPIPPPPVDPLEDPSVLVTNHD